MRYSVVAGSLTLALLVPACRTLSRSSQSPPARATIRSASGAQLGVLNLEGTSAGVRITGALTGLPAGTHGIHVHAVGRCDSPEFTTAGGHFNPAGMKHGLENPAGPHAGDMPSIAANGSGRANVDIVTPRVTLDASGPASAFDADGSAIVVHAAADDQKTDPSGNSGARIACGIVERGS